MSTEPTGIEAAALAAADDDARSPANSPQNPVEGNDPPGAQSDKPTRRRSSGSSSRRGSVFLTPPPVGKLTRANSAYMLPTGDVDDEEDSDAEPFDPLTEANSDSGCIKCLAAYHRSGKKVQKLTTNPSFDQFIIFVILVAGVLVGVQTYDLDDGTLGRLEVVDTIILVIFTAEVILKIWAEGRRPIIYFLDHWNKFDFFIVVAAFTPGISSQATILRLLRLLRVLKLVKALPQLRIIIISLIGSFSSLGYIAMLMGMLFYLFAILAVMLFGTNDPYFFGNLHIAFLSLWRSATGEDWTDLMYIGMYGCDAVETGTGGTFYDDDTYRHLCDQPSAQYAVSAIYHILFNIFAGLILLNLMVGVIIGSIFEAKAGINGDAIKVVLQRAENLSVARVATEGPSSSSPFCRIFVGDQKKRSKVLKKNLNPEWKETFLFDLTDVEKEKITFQVFDWRRCGSNDFLGKAKLDFSNLRWNKPASFSIELNGVASGTLFVQVLRIAGPNHVLTEDEKDQWDKLQDKYFVASELLQECNSLLEQRKAVRARAARKPGRRWSSAVTESTLMQSMKNRMSSLLSRLAAAKVKPMTKEQIQKLYGSNTVFDFKSREQKIHHHRSTGGF